MRDATAVFVVALALRVAFVVLTKPEPLAGVDSVEYDTMGRELLAGHGFVSVIGFVRPPLYPVFVAACYAVGGVAALQAAQVVLSALTAVQIGLIAQLLYGRRDRGLFLVTGLVGACYPWFFQYAATIATETLFTFATLLGFAALLSIPRRPGLLWTLLAGVLVGAAGLVRANLLVLTPALGLWLLWQTRSLVRPTVLAAGVLIAILPFTLYNVATGNGLFLATNGSGFSFFIGNGPDETRRHSDNIPDTEWRELNRTVYGPASLQLLGCDSLEQCLDRVPLTERDRYFYDAAFRYIRGNTGEWAVTELKKLRHALQPWVEPRVYSMPIVVVSGVSYATVAFLALLGLRRMPRSSAAFVLIVFVAATLSSVVWFVVLRYRFTLVDPILIAAAAGPARDVAGAVWRQTRSLTGTS